MTTTAIDMPTGIYKRTKPGNQLGLKRSDETKRKLSLAHQGIQAGEKNPAWRGGIYGYKTKNIGGKKIKLHRIIMERLLGRLLLFREVVHHWNEKKHDNEPANLQLFRHRAAHQRLHRFAKRNGIPVEQFKFAQPWLFSS